MLPDVLTPFPPGVPTIKDPVSGEILDATLLWSKLTELGSQALIDKDEKVWRIGDLALEVSKFWPDETTLAKFARDIGLDKASGTVKPIYDWRDTAEVFPEAVRRPLLETCRNLYWTHYRVAARWAKRLKKEGVFVLSADVKNHLIAANTNEMKVGEFDKYLKAENNRDTIAKRLYFPATEVERVGGGFLVFVAQADVELLQQTMGERSFSLMLRADFEISTLEAEQEKKTKKGHRS